MDSVKEKEQLIEELNGAPASGPSPDSVRQYLKLVRELRTRESESVAKYGSLLLEKHKKKLAAEELWLVYEQVALACMDIQANRCAQSCVSAICSEFPNSVRAKRLKAMFFESTDLLSRAESIYDEILVQDPSNDIILKRKIAICKTRGDLVAAAQALNVYLETFMMDRDAWEELAEIYLKLQMYKQAAHCYEELLLLAPTQLTYHLRYADTLYTMGTAQDVALAKMYYTHAVEASHGTSIRALYGVCLCCSHPKLRKGGGGDDNSIGALSAKALIKFYTNADSPLVPFVKSVLQSQGLLD